ncbi:sensor domain-containing phosphodiesterase [Acidiphilium sp.]|uniref:sensor domain-containing phosphodiesterase n=1 Tax=Acidiphilium sp. TaxID=527 RepID=UPI003D03B869
MDVYPADMERERLTIVDHYGPHDHLSRAVFDRFTRLAASLLRVPIAAISLVVNDRIIFKSIHGLVLSEIDRAHSFCDIAIESDALLLVPDARLDPRFAGSPLLHAPTNIRFYAGMPLVSPEGYRIGTFSLADVRPRWDFGIAEQSLIIDMSRSVMAELELHRRLTESKRLVAELSLRQQIAADAADAASFREALDRVLDRIRRYLDADYCITPEADIAAGTYRFLSGCAVDPVIQSMFDAIRDGNDHPLSEIYCAAALTDGAVIDDHPLVDSAALAAFPVQAEAVRRGTRRVMAFPLFIAERRLAFIVGFRTEILPQATVALCRSLALSLAPQLHGRIREEALHRSNILLDRANRALQTVIACNQAIATVPDEPGLIQSICSIAVDIGRYTAAWVGMAATDGTVTPVAKAGFGLDHLMSLHITWADTPFGQDPTGRAIREGRTVVIHDLLNQPALQIWRDKIAIPGQFTSALAIPLRGDGGAILGAISLLSDDPEASHDPRRRGFDEAEIKLLTQLASDLAYGIVALRTRSARDAAVAAQRDSEQRLARLLDTSPTVVYALERPPNNSDPLGWHLVEISANIERLFGHTQVAALRPRWWIDHIHPDDRADALAAERNLSDRGRIVHQYRFACTSGIYCWVRDEKILLPGTATQPERIVGAWVDVSDKQKADEEIYRLAFFDQLTGMPNRAMLQRHLASALVHAQDSGLSGALLFIDLSGFNLINDLHGHHIGDLVLTQAARRFRAALRGPDIIARLAGDKFAVLLADLADKPDAAATITQQIATKLLDALAPPIMVATHECHVGADIGIAIFPHRAGAVEDLFRQADIAMQQAKAASDTALMFFEPSMQDRVARRHMIERTLREAIDHDRLEVWLQSQVDRAGEVVGAEALVRLRRADGIIVPPGAFIPIAEATGAILAMGRWMIRAVCRIIAGEALRGQKLRVSINVSPRQLHDPAFVDDILAALAETGADPHHLMIEITENLLIDRIEETRAILNTLATRGIRFSVDDFGTGYSSLGYLQTLPITEIKIDRGFIRHLPGNTRDATLAEAILAMTRHLGLSTVAEGVETEAQAEFLLDRQCDILQGYLFGRPEPAPRWLRRRADDIASGRTREIAARSSAQA